MEHFRELPRQEGAEFEILRTPEMEQLRQLIDRVITPTVTGKGERLQQLEQLLEAEPQVDENGNLRYMVTSGMAVELTTGYEREHHDLDLVIMNPRQISQWEIHGTDNVTPERYWANMRFNPQFLQDTARYVPTRQGTTSSLTVAVVHPGIIMVQKSSNAFGRPPRQKDYDDVEAIVQHWKKREAYTRAWNPIVSQAIDSLPEKQIDTTVARIREALKQDLQK